MTGRLIHDYALEPSLVAECGNSPFLCQVFKDAHWGWDAGCLPVQYPSKSTWKKQVINLVGDDKRYEALVTFLPRIAIIRSASTWKDAATWLENAECENGFHSFHRILALDNPRKHPNVVCRKDISSKTVNPAPPSVTVNRIATSMAAGIEPLLLYAKSIRFIDPHFCALHKRFRDPLCEFLRIICDNKRKVELELHASADRVKVSDHDIEALADKLKVSVDKLKALDAGVLAWEVFRQECEDELPRIIPKGFTLTIYLWKKREKGQGFHNRYILTDIGGVQLGTGLDQESTGGTQDEDIISRMSSLDFHRWLNKYSRSTPAFNLEKQPIVIEGRRNIR